MREIVTVVLAAGRGERIGGPKALLAWPARPGSAAGPDVPLAIAHAEARLAAESDRVLIVTRKAMVNALIMYVRPGIDLLSSDAADELGPAGSLAFAVSRMGEPEAVLVTPVDTVPARAETVAALLTRLAADGPEGSTVPLAVRPRYNRRAGHPVALRPAALTPYRGANPPPLRDHLKTLGPACVDVDVDDPTVLIDIDTAADVAAVLRAPPRFL